MPDARVAAKQKLRKNFQFGQRQVSESWQSSASNKRRNHKTQTKSESFTKWSTLKRAGKVDESARELFNLVAKFAQFPRWLFGQERVKLPPHPHPHPPASKAASVSGEIMNCLKLLNRFCGCS